MTIVRSESVRRNFSLELDEKLDSRGTTATTALRRSIAAALDLETGRDLVIDMKPIGYVEAVRPHAEDDFWGGHQSCIALVEGFGAAALQGLSEFSHVEIIYFFHEVTDAKITTGARHPRNNTEWPAVGIFAQRGKNRPNRLGSTICRLISAEGTRIFVAELDAIDKTPVLDIKPVMSEFLPRVPVRQPAWSHELMCKYWLTKH
jgi:tRNA (adenine37-N6)-methyltransferase